jgi:mannose-6-phosphate isomerase
MLGFVDPNHKPEMALAITPFTALCGFLPLENIATYLDKVPELASLIPRAVLDNFRAVVPTADPNSPAAKQALRDVFSAIMTAPVDKFTSQLAKLLERFKSRSVHAEEENVRELVLRLNSQFPNDIGTFCSFLLNYIKLSPGEAIFLGAGEPHAYVSGGQHLPTPLHVGFDHKHTILQISSSAWPTRTTLSVLGSRRSYATSQIW